jgi:catechol 2,3-dioxygenase-like lactoylglutathione lyase family enzyme
VSDLTSSVADMNALGIVVSDLAASVAFYAKLGLAFQTFGGEHAEATLPGGVRVMLDTEQLVKSLVPGWSRPSGSHVFSLAFQMPSPDAVDALFGELTAAGHPAVREPWDAEWGQRYASLLDPDGNGIDLYCPLKS